MFKVRFRLLFIAAVISLITAGSLISLTKTHSNNVPSLTLRAPVQARLIKAAEPNFTVHGSIYFQLNNNAALEQLIIDQQNPQNPSYHRWLNPTEFAHRFGTPEDKYLEALNWLRDNGINITRSWRNRLSIDFSAPAQQIQKVFGVQMNMYQIKDEEYFGAEGIPQMPEALAQITTQLKLNNFARYRSMRREPDKKVELNPDALDDSRNLALGPQDFYKVYNVSPLLKEGIDGTGQTIGIVADSDFNMSDIDKFRSKFKLPAVTVEKFAIGPVDFTDAEAEVLLDVQIAGEVAPMANIQVAMVNQQFTGLDKTIEYFINNLPDTKVIDISFGLCEAFNFIGNEQDYDRLYKQAAAQGQSIMVSSGDDGANDCGDGNGRQVNALAASAFVTAVGGTSVNAGFDKDGNATGNKGETVWAGSGGGLSLVYDRPAYQLGRVTEGNTRAVPDISLLADPNEPGFIYVQGGRFFTIGGTSAAAPSWAGIVALANQLAKSNGLGLVNDRIYQLGVMQQQGGDAVYNDITSGNNSNHGVKGFQATKGYDMATGWGSPNVDKFVRAFAGLPNARLPIVLTNPNGGEFTSGTGSIGVNWMIDDPVSLSVTKQDLLLSTDQGVTYTPIAMDLGGNVRSFTYKTTMVSTTARFRIVAHRSDGPDISDNSNSNVNLNTFVRLESAFYDKGAKALTIVAVGLGGDLQVSVNGKVLTKAPKMVDDFTVVFKGGTKKFNLRAGENSVVITIDGVQSAPYKIFL